MLLSWRKSPAIWMPSPKPCSSIKSPSPKAAHNVVLLHLLRCMEPMLAQNVRQNFELLYARREMLPLVSTHRTRIFEAIMAGKPEEAREASHRHLAFIEEIMLDRSREESRRERALRRLEQRKN
ncbi:pyruvate dehydrogenase complex repressor [Salmonella enterica subsp. enterica]|uniref:Pyruvate dehydrogenase complex repressor n=1 Tax=Salmonella enterica I TaxID=59201 RepID=A0A3S4LQ41_SALET|nr:pyruvate dehydrogenase complex repressor [Salmonella enterica subsp. enterica]